MINTGTIKLASGEYWLTINTNANAVAELDDVSDLEYDFDLDDSQDIISKIGIIPGVLTAKFNDTLNSLSSLYDVLESEIGTPSPTTGYTTIGATLYRRPYGEAQAQEFPFQVQFNGVDLNELEAQTSIRLLPPQQSTLNVASYFNNATGNLPTKSYNYFLNTGTPISNVYAPGDVMQSLTANLNPNATQTIFESSPVLFGGDVPPVLYADNLNIGAPGNVSFFVTRFTGGATGTEFIYDKYRSMAGLDSAVFGSAFGVNFYVGRLTDNQRVTLTFDDIENVKLIKVNRDINTQVFSISNPAPLLSQIVDDVNTTMYNRLSTRNVGIDYAGHSPLLTKGQVINTTAIQGEYTGWETPDIEPSATLIAQKGYSNGLGSAAWRVEHQRIEVEILSIDKVRPWQTFEFDASDADIPTRYKNKVFRPSSIQYDLKTDKATITAYQIS